MLLDNVSGGLIAGLKATNSRSAFNFIDEGEIRDIGWRGNNATRAKQEISFVNNE